MQNRIKRYILSLTALLITMGLVATNTGATAAYGAERAKQTVEIDVSRVVNSGRSRRNYYMLAIQVKLCLRPDRLCRSTTERIYQPPLPGARVTLFPETERIVQRVTGYSGMVAFSTPIQNKVRLELEYPVSYRGMRVIPISPARLYVQRTQSGSFNNILVTIYAGVR